MGFNEHFAPTCVREHSYRYESHDTKYETLRYILPKECAGYPLAQNSLCQRVYKITATTDLRKYTAPARGSQSCKEIAKRRSAVELVNAYLKGFIQLNHLRHRTGQKRKSLLIWLHRLTIIWNWRVKCTSNINQLKAHIRVHFEAIPSHLLIFRFQMLTWITHHFHDRHCWYKQTPFAT